MSKYISLFCAATILSGCQVISPKECQSTDWLSRGINDGNNGRSANILSEYIQACSEANITVDSKAWRSGYNTGIRSYCAPENGYTVGRQGLTYNGVCPNSEFLKNYNTGRSEYELEQQKQELRNEIAQLKNQLASETDREKKKTLKQDIKQLEKRLDNLHRPNISFEISL
ncbi:DUF2799 domain-containing protein [Parashewanella spongiae]|uniref:DUF2799 domain-containing protein n=1 Tax=Parashewanella spongiae TaxID=342950 RepID=A0A3A6TVH6_9GAMM|nr:DUF2799 domain-containing protein [Parashewanella spongiae]MCL1078360.1 DUF2799 domain-containing protein [Parashewanella spongiae]RJY16883.1 DUF2799 domain-containing protein [Parashewanella spongiae]